MIKIEKSEVTGWEHVVRGMRNPLNSWDKSDSKFAVDLYWDEECTLPYKTVDDIGEKDLKLMRNLCKAGTDHRKFMRMITVYVDITAPLYWWKEFDTYKVGTVANSCSTMHKIHAKDFMLEDFSCEHLNDAAMAHLRGTINYLNDARSAYNWCNTESKKDWWWQMIQLLPSSYNQKRTIQLNYEVLANMYKSRKNHKLDEWKEFCKWIEGLPYFKEIVLGEEQGEEA